MRGKTYASSLTFDLLDCCWIEDGTREADWRADCCWEIDSCGSISRTPSSFLRVSKSEACIDFLPNCIPLPPIELVVLQHELEKEWIEMKKDVRINWLLLLLDGCWVGLKARWWLTSSSSSKGSRGIVVWIHWRTTTRRIFAAAIRIGTSTWWRHGHVSSHSTNAYNQKISNWWASSI